MQIDEIPTSADNFAILDRDGEIFDKQTQVEKRLLTDAITNDLVVKANGYDKERVKAGAESFVINEELLISRTPEPRLLPLLLPQRPSPMKHLSCTREKESLLMLVDLLFPVTQWGL